LASLERDPEIAIKIIDLQTYLTLGPGGLLDIIRKIRVVLHTYCRTINPAQFLADDWLGDMVRKIREAAQTTRYARPDRSNRAELTGFVRRTLRIVNAMQA